MHYFTSDTHFGHNNIIKYCSRPFVDVDEMDRVLVDNINKVVRPRDVLYHLGDFAFGDPEVYLNKIKCENIHLIPGNHDKGIKHNWRIIKDLHNKGRLKLEDPIVDIKIARVKITMCHYPMSSWNCSKHRVLHLFGHAHGKPVYGQRPSSKDVGVDTNGYKPYSFEDIYREMVRDEKPRM